MTGHDLQEILVPIFAMVFIFGFPAIIIFWAIYTKHRERMRLIEKGISPEEAKKYFIDSEKKPRNPYGSLKWGLILLFLGIGIFAGNVIEEIYDFNEGVVFGIVLLSAGIGFLIYYLLVKNKLQESVNSNTSNNN